MTLECISTFFPLFFDILSAFKQDRDNIDYRDIFGHNNHNEKASYC